MNDFTHLDSLLHHITRPMDETPLSPDEVRVARNLKPELPVSEDDAVLTYGTGNQILLTLRVYGNVSEIHRVTIGLFEREVDITSLLSDAESCELDGYIRENYL